MTKRIIHAAYTPPATRQDDINYPGAVGDMQQRQTSRATVDYDTYVLRYAPHHRNRRFHGRRRHRAPRNQRRH